MDRARTVDRTTDARPRPAARPIAPPAGMRDLLPPEAAERRALARRIATEFARYGYELVTTPPFEHAEVIERGLDTIDRRDLLRFVDTDTGEVALMRPDITPQIARVVATRLADRPPPYRLAYEGSVIRRRRGRARRQRQIAQAGVECIGLAGPGADVEVIELASSTLSALGLHAHRIELGLSPVARTALEALPAALRDEAATHLARKDGSAIEEIVARASLRGRARATLIEMVDLWGGPDVLERARAVFGTARDTVARLDALAELHAWLVDRGLGDRIAFDLGEVRGFGYYTGPSFVLLAEGPGEPIGGGGRYDELLGRFGAPLPATGLGLDLDHLEWALATAGVASRDRGPVRIGVAGDDERLIATVAHALRDAGAIVATLPHRDAAAALEHAQAWSYDAAIAVGRDARAVRVSDASSRAWSRTAIVRDAQSVLEWVSGPVGAAGESSRRKSGAR